MYKEGGTMRICFITNNISEKGGVQRVLSVVANGLSRDNCVTILMTSPEKISSELVYPHNESIQIIRDSRISSASQKYFLNRCVGYINKKVVRFKNITTLKNIFFPKGELKIYNEFFRKHEFDVIVGVQPRAAGMVSLLDTSASKIGWMHNTYDAYFNSPNRYQWRQELLYQKLLAKLDRLIVLTNHDKRQYGTIIENADKVIRIYNPLSFFAEQKSTLMNKKIIFVARLQYEQKGLGYLLEIIKILKKSVPNIQIDIVGDGPDKEQFINEAKKYGVFENLNLIGMVDDVQKYYCESDIFLSTSKYEGFGLVVTEAMECGLPVVSFATEGPSEIIYNGVNGFLIEDFNTEEFAQKVLLLYNDDNKRTAFGTMAQKRAADFAEEKIVRKWNKILVDAVENNNFDHI